MNFFNWLFGKKKEKVVIYREIIARKDIRLGRNVNHDSRSLNFPFNTSGLEIKSIKHERFIPILNQGQLGSCTGNAGVGAIHTSPFQNKSNTIYPGNQEGAVKLYSDATIIDPFNGTYPPQDTGSNGVSIGKALLNAGLIEKFEWTFTLEDALKALTKYPIIVGTRWYDGMFTPDGNGFIHPTGNVGGGHEYLVRQNVVEEGFVWIDNSWGKEWGIEGRAKLSWLDFGELLKQQGDVVVLIPKADTAPIKRILKYQKPYMVGEDVKTLQTNLKELKYLSGTIDGVFGRATETAVKKFQTARGLVSDGIVGSKTFSALESELKKKIEMDKFKLQVGLEVIARDFLYQCKKAGYDLRITCGFRSFAEQQALYDQGRKDKTKPKVTNAKPGQSQHNFGKAFDVCFLGKEPYPNDDFKWKAIADIAKTLGLKPGYYFKTFKDKPHFEI